MRPQIRVKVGFPHRSRPILDMGTLPSPEAELAVRSVTGFRSFPQGTRRDLVWIRPGSGMGTAADYSGTGGQRSTVSIGTTASESLGSRRRQPKELLARVPSWLLEPRLRAGA